MDSTITDTQKQQLGSIVEAAKKDELALFEVTDKHGQPAVLLIAFERDEEGKGGRMAPLARIDVDLLSFTPPKGVETIEPDKAGEDLEKLRRMTEVDNAGEGC